MCVRESWSQPPTTKVCPSSATTGPGTPWPPLLASESSDSASPPDALSPHLLRCVVGPALVTLSKHFSFLPFYPLACVRIVHACKAATRWGQCWGYLYPGAFLCRVGRLFRPNQPWTLLMQPSRPSPSARALPPPSSPHLTFPLLRVPPPHYPTPSVQSWQA